MADAPHAALKAFVWLLAVGFSVACWVLITLAVLAVWP